ncbi:MAG: nucleoside recognition domain-containing protein [Clostridia bacterium]
MLNKIWPVFLIISFIYAIFSGRLPETNNSIFEYTASAVNLGLTLVGTMCLWCGIIKIAMKTSIINKLIKLFKPLLKKLFPEISENDEIHKEISMNIIANLLGLGNAATPLGLKAMKSLQKTNKNKKELSNSMAMLIVLNTASIQIIPTTVIAIRNSLGSTEPTKMLVPIWIATICAAVAAVTATKIFMKKW